MTDYSEPLIELRRLLRQVEDACNDQDWKQANERVHAMFNAWLTKMESMESGWASCSQTCARLQGERDNARSEVERLRKAVSIADAFYAATMADLKCERAINERLREELAAAQRDAERYRWLRDRHLRSMYHPIGEAIGMDEVIHGDDPDTAIDAAMAREKRHE